MGLHGDFIVQGAGADGLVKTPPLWGLRVRIPYLHDGSVADDDFTTRMNNAIARHDDPFKNMHFSQGRFAAEAYAALSESDKIHVINFLGSLRCLEFDHDVHPNKEINVFDFVGCAYCDTCTQIGYAPGLTQRMDQ